MHKFNDFSRYCIKPLILSLITIFLLGSNLYAAAPIISEISTDQTGTGRLYQRTPILLAGENVTWKKEFGPDDVYVNPESGRVTWAIPDEMPGEAFYIGVRAFNSDGSDLEIWILKVGDGKFVYVDPNATINGDGLSWANACNTISAGSAKTIAGDTLIVKNGTYTGEINRFYNDSGSSGSLPASGTPNNWTTVLAETPGGVVFDGQNARQPFRLKGSYDSGRGTTSPGTHPVEYVAFKGLIAGRSNSSGPFSISTVEHVKLILCGGYDQAPDSGSIFNIQRSGDVLLESCFAWGHGREMIAAFLSDRIIFRRCVARMDRSTSTEPIGGFVHYGGRNSMTANCIMIDSDQPEYWINHTYLAGAFCNDCGAYCDYEYGQVKNVFVTHCLSLNNYGKLIVSSNSRYPDVVEPVKYQNIVVWDMKAWYGNGQHSGSPNSLVVSRGDIEIDHSTFGVLSSPAASIESGVFFNSWQDTTSVGDKITNSIVYDVKDYGNVGGGLFYSWNLVNYNNIFNTGTISVNNTNPTNTRIFDPIQNGLKYITRIEPDTELSSGGEDGGRIGADLTYMYGKSGTMWEETGYNSESTTKMWPFPYEDLIREKMRDYLYDDGRLTGKRGFCADGQSLTKYVWEYLGNDMPDDIYGSSALLYNLPGKVIVN